MLKKLFARLKKHVGWSIIGVISAAGVAGILVDLFYGNVPAGSETSFSTLANFLGSVGKAVLGGGVSGAIIKIMATEGFFLDAVAAVAYGPEGLERRGEEEQKEIWRNLTRMVYLPFLRPSELKDSPEEWRLTLASELEDSISKTFTYDKKFYIERLHRRLEVRWKDAAREVVEVLDTQDSTIIPFKKHEEAEWTTISTPDFGRGMQEYAIAEVECNITPKPAKPETIEVRDARRVATYYLQGHDKHDIHRYRVWSWALDIDPIMAFNSPYVVRGMDIDIHNRAEGLLISFKDHGRKDLFGISGGVGRQIEFGQYSSFKAQSLVLPDQGCLLLFLRQRPAQEALCLPPPSQPERETADCAE